MRNPYFMITYWMASTSSPLRPCRSAGTATVSPHALSGTR
jgi:hypothetical protein